MFYISYIEPKVSAVSRKYHLNEIIWFINSILKSFITDQSIYKTGHRKKLKIIKMRQNRKLPGKNNFPKSESRTQMLRSESDQKARNHRTLRQYARRQD